MPFAYQTMRPLGRANLSHRRPSDLSTFYYGVCYYPEHWTEAERHQDAERMAQAGLNIVRLAEFAWDRMEPREGAYDFSFFDEQIEHLARHGIATILCTPTAAPPRWLTRRFPQTLRCNQAGQPMQHGSRQHCCHSNDRFRDYSRRITAALAGHFKNNPHVVGWQTDNEFLCHFSQCYCAACQEAFPHYLRWRYENRIGRLNADWGTAFWAQTYEDFGDIPLPREAMPAYENPAHRLAYKQYLADAVARFQHEQVEILRSAQSAWFIMHNGIFSSVDNRGDFARDLNFLGYDSYPCFCYDYANRAATHAANLDQARGYAGNFVVPEHQSGPGGQRPYFHDNPEPGEVRRLSYASLARGADSLLYFRWRTCRFGAEEYWCGILDHDNQPRRRYHEVAQMGGELKRIGPELLGTSVHTDVRSGGVLLVGARTATRDPRNQVVAQTIPGCLSGLCGITVEEYGHLNRPDERAYRLASVGTDTAVLAKHWYEWIQPQTGTEVMAVWTTRHLKGEAAVTRRKVGRGQVWYVGTYLTEDIRELLLPRLCEEAGLTATHPCWKPGLEIVRRESAQKNLWFLINQSEAPLRVENPPRGLNLITQAQTGTTLDLAPHDVAVILG